MTKLPLNLLIPISVEGVQAENIPLQVWPRGEENHQVEASRLTVPTT